MTVATNSAAGLACGGALLLVGGVILGLVLGFGFRNFLARRIATWLPPGFER